MNRYILISILAILTFFSCKEPYYPDLHDMDKLLVVEGLLTDESNIIKVTLSKTSAFQDKGLIPEEGAKLYVADDLGRKFLFTQKKSGYYESIGFTPEYGRTYILYITTKANKVFKSNPQTLMPPSSLEPFEHVVKSKTLQVPANGVYINKSIKGLEFSITQEQKAEDLPYFRYSAEMLVEYDEKFTIISNPDTLQELFYCWKRYSPNKYFNLNDPLLKEGNQHEHILAFCPIDSLFFGVIYVEDWSSGQPPPVLYSTSSKNLYYFALTVKKYHISEEVHKFYQDINKQLEANNRIFDPITFQIKGNLVCVDDLDEPVLGIFEVASTSLKTYAFSDFQKDGSIKVEEIEPIDIESLPLVGRMYASYPDFWIYKN